MIKVLVVDDQNIFREGLAALIGSNPEISVVGLATNGLEAIDFLEKNHKTDIVLMDYRMPLMNGLSAAERICEGSPHTKVILLTMYYDEDLLKEALLAGAKSVLSKDNEPEEIIHAIKEVYNGKYYLPSNGIALLVKKLEQYSKTGINEKEFKATDQADKFLSEREQQILELLLEGMTSQEVADKLSLSRRTVESTKVNMLQKTRTKNIAQLVALAISDGLIQVFTKDKSKSPKGIPDGEVSLK